MIAVSIKESLAAGFSRVFCPKRQSKTQAETEEKDSVLLTIYIDVPHTVAKYSYILNLGAKERFLDNEETTKLCLCTGLYQLKCYCYLDYSITRGMGPLDHARIICIRLHGVGY